MSKTASSPATPRAAYICLDGYTGRTEQAVMVVGETPKKYRIRAVMRTKLGGAKWLYTGEMALVPKHAVRFS
jgi:hypothetical protein